METPGLHCKVTSISSNSSKVSQSSEIKMTESNNVALHPVGSKTLSLNKKILKMSKKHKKNQKLQKNLKNSKKHKKMIIKKLRKII